MRHSLSFPGLLLRLEGAAVLVAAVLLYFTQGGSWLLFALLLLAPDLAMIGYALGPGTGSVVYNLAHTYVLPIALAGLALLFGSSLLLLLAFIWLAHLGMDRMLGFGLKYPTNFKDSHLNRV